jgi:deoxyribonuclease V
VDASFSKERVCGAAVVIDYRSGELVEQTMAELPLTYTYIPGLLSFREAPALLVALGELSQLPDLLLVDGHGLAHPRGFGLACHLGVLLDLPTIGCAKSPLVGEYSSLAEPVGSTSDLVEKGQIWGMAVRTRAGVKPVFVSVGHRVDLPSAVRHVLACTRGYKLPEPTRQADILARLTRMKD